MTLVEVPQRMQGGDRTMSEGQPSVRMATRKLDFFYGRFQALHSVDIDIASQPAGINLPGMKRGKSPGTFSSYHPPRSLGGATVVFADGSGLSTLDRVTPRAQVQLLAYAHHADWGPWLHSSLPVAGDSELLRRRMRNTPAEGNLHAKTGTTNDVIALAGYVTAVNGEVLAFSFLYNGRDRWTAKSMIDVMSETLASFGR